MRWNKGSQSILRMAMTMRLPEVHDPAPVKLDEGKLEFTRNVEERTCNEEEQVERFSQ